MEALSTYWVRFFKSSGFQTDVASRYAVIFSNNRIKPDMLPELDKPTLKEMGITLMGDMIAILRYAKKVVDETTCKKLLVTAENPSPITNSAKPQVKRTIRNLKSTIKPAAVKKTQPSKFIKTTNSAVKSLESTSSSTGRPASVAAKKNSPLTGASKLYSDYIQTTSKPRISQIKRKYESNKEDTWFNSMSSKRSKNESNDDDYDDDDEKDGEEDETYSTFVKIRPPVMDQVPQQSVQSKKNVFHRLGDSKVSSTTNFDSSFTPSFTVTGIGKDIRNDSVFGRLGNKSSEDKMYSLSKNGSTKPTSILKTRTPLLGTKVFTSKSVIRKPTVGTMRADEEASKKAGSGIKKLARSSSNFKPRENPLRNTGLVRKLPTTRKLASETVELPAKSRLGMSKQVTFNHRTKINHIRKEGIFNRLGKF